MKRLNWLVIVIFSLGLTFLSGCSHFGSGKKSVESSEEGVQTSGLIDEDGFVEHDISSANRLKAPYNQTYRFDFDSFGVKSNDVESIKVQANYLVSNPKAKVRLEGNADARGSREYNVALGWRRAKAVSAVLKKYGVNNAQIVIVSFGKEKPIAFGQDEYSYNQNRRVNLVYESK